MTAQEELSRRISRDGICRAVQKKIDEGRADFTDTARYTDRAAELLGEVLAAYVPDMPPEERETLCKGLLRQRYTDTNAMLNAVQRVLDAAQGLHLAPQIADYPEERVNQAAHALADETVPVETIVRRAKSAPATIARSFQDDYIEKNAAFRDSAGLKCYITRIAAGGCCKWCTAMAGRYSYGEEPDDIYRRHDNCSCTVTYENGRQRQDVWSKRTWEVPEASAGASDTARFTAEQAQNLQVQNSPESLTRKAERDKIKSAGKSSSSDIPSAEQYAQKVLGIQNAAYTGLSSSEANALNQKLADSLSGIGRKDALVRKAVEAYLTEQYKKTSLPGTDDALIHAMVNRDIDDFIKKHLEPASKDAVKDALGVKRGKPFSIEESLARANPDYVFGTATGINCQRCVQAYELLRRGYPVEALPASQSLPAMWGSECFIDKASARVKRQNKTVEAIGRGFQMQMSEADVNRAIGSAPDGARFAIYVAWKARGAHVFVAEKVNGKIRYIDPQSNETDASGHFSAGIENRFGLFRMDDKPLTASKEIVAETIKKGKKR